MANNNSQDNASDYNTPPEELIPVFPYENQQSNNPPQDLFPVFDYDNPPPNTPPAVLFPPINNPPHYNPPQNQPRPLTEDELYEQDMRELLKVQAEEEEEARAREEYLREKQARRNARCAWRIQHGLPRVSTSDDDSSASSDEGWVSDDSFY